MSGVSPARRYAHLAKHGREPEVQAGEPAAQLIGGEVGSRIASHAALLNERRASEVHLEKKHGQRDCLERVVLVVRKVLAVLKELCTPLPPNEMHEEMTDWDGLVRGEALRVRLLGGSLEQSPAFIARQQVRERHLRRTRGEKVIFGVRKAFTVLRELTHDAWGQPAWGQVIFLLFLFLSIVVWIVNAWFFTDHFPTDNFDQHGRQIWCTHSRLFNTIHCSDEPIDSDPYAGY